MLYPRISIVTPSFNQAQFLERTIRSVLDQGYPNLEYIVIDGGSTDGSVDIIRKYESQLAYWVSEADEGQAHAINKGLARATGEWVAWQNSDDIYYPETFDAVAQQARRRPELELIVGDMNLIDAEDRVLRDVRYVTPTYESMLAEGMVLANQAAFWRRSVHVAAGFLDQTYDCAFDYEWFLRILQARPASAHVAQLMGALRQHGDTKTSNRAAVFRAEFDRILAGRNMPSWQRRLYQLRRMTLMLGAGRFYYVLRGIKARAQV